METLDPALLGLYSSVVSEAVKLIPWFRQSESRVLWLAFAVVFFGVLYQHNLGEPAALITDWQTLVSKMITALAFSFASYKTIVKPLAGTMGLASQPKIIK